MTNLQNHRPLNRAHFFTERALSAITRFMHIEAMSGIVLILAASAALIWANSPFSMSYEQFWHLPLTLTFGTVHFSCDMHFFVNDVLMGVFFLVAGMEIRREMHDGALANIRQATLPFIAALGGVTMPALLYLAFNLEPLRHHGWAVPTATDIAFAVGILALLGRHIPSNIRIILLSLAIIDDIIAVLIIAFFYSGSIDISGFAFCGAAIGLVLLMQWLGFHNAWLYTLPAAILWYGLYKTGAHPSLAGVVLGFLTPVLPPRSRHAPLMMMEKAVQNIAREAQHKQFDGTKIATSLDDLRNGEKKLLPPVTRIQNALHPWVAFGVMPIFALANAGIAFNGLDLQQGGSLFIMAGVMIGLFIGKPLGVFIASFIAVKIGLCRLPPQVDWAGILLIGLLAGIGFTMAIFVAMLAFLDPNQLASAKIAVLLGSSLSAIFGLLYGRFYIRRYKNKVW